MWRDHERGGALLGSTYRRAIASPQNPTLGPAQRWLLSHLRRDHECSATLLGIQQQWSGCRNRVSHNNPCHRSRWVLRMENAVSGRCRSSSFCRDSAILQYV